MADFLKNIVGGSSSDAPAETPEAQVQDADFADFADAPSPEPIPFEAAMGATQATATPVPFTKWYNVHERHSLSEFKGEGIILAAIIIIFTFHFIGSRRNKSKAQAWLKAHEPLLESEFALVGFNREPGSEGNSKPENMLRQKSLFEFAGYATGRQNVAFADFNLTMKKRFNPLMVVFETAAGFFFDSMDAPADSVEAAVYPFDGKEAQIIPTGQVPGVAELRAKDSAKSTYDGFVFAVVHKDVMKSTRDERYDVSITFTKDHGKLPAWVTVMSESAEITAMVLTNELIMAIEKAGDMFQSLIITDQPVEKPRKIEDVKSSHKRIFLNYKISPTNDYTAILPLFSIFLRLADHLAASAHLRPEVLKKLKVVRDDAVKQLQKADEDEKAEERALERDKVRKAKRDAELNALDAKAQKKYLDKEKDKQMRKASKKQTVRA